MAPETPNMQAMLERLDNLERQTAELSELVGGIINAHMDEIRAKIDQAAAKKGTIEAEEFILRDAQGHLGASLCFLESGPALVLYDANRRGGAVLRLEKEGAAIYLNDLAGTEVIVLKAGPDGSALSISDNEGFRVSLGNLHMLARRALEAHGVAKPQQFPQAIIVGKGDKAIWSAPPPPKRSSLFSRLFHHV